MRYNESIWEDLDLKEKKIYHLYEVFQNRTNRRGVVTKWIPQASRKSVADYDQTGEYPGDFIRNSKNWKYFEETYEMFEEDQNFDEQIFIDSVFRNIPKTKRIFPAQLRTKKIIQQYKDYRMKLKMTDQVSTEKRIMRDISNTYKFISRKMNKKKLDANDLNNFFTDVKDNNIISEGIFFCIQEMISPFYYSISKSFEDAYSELDQDVRDEIIDGERLLDLRMLIKLKKFTYNFAKELFGRDIL